MPSQPPIQQVHQVALGPGQGTQMAYLGQPLPLMSPAAIVPVGGRHPTASMTSKATTEVGPSGDTRTSDQEEAPEIRRGGRRPARPGESKSAKIARMQARHPGDYPAPAPSPRAPQAEAPSPPSLPAPDQPARLAPTPPAACCCRSRTARPNAGFGRGSA